MTPIGIAETPLSHCFYWIAGLWPPRQSWSGPRAETHRSGVNAILSVMAAVPRIQDGGATPASHSILLWTTREGSEPSIADGDRDSEAGLTDAPSPGGHDLALW